MPNSQREIFVFGSNLAGRHGAGSAKAAFENHGAVYGQGVGYWGDSYAIPTKDKNIQVMPLADIARHISNFVRFANNHQETNFRIVNVGCGLAGFTPQQIAPLFKGAGSNCLFTPEFEKILGEVE